MVQVTEEPLKDEVVISGFSGRYPCSDSVEEFEHNLYNGVDMVTVDDSRWPVGLWRLSPRNGKVKSYERFDSQFFNLTVNEAEFVEPQERLALEIAFEAICDSGTNPETLKGSKRTGVFHGSCYVEQHEYIDEIDKVPAPVTLPTRLSQYFGLKGPYCYIDTACGSSLSALNEAFDAVNKGLCDSAIVIGTNSLFRARLSSGFRDLGMINVDGKCKCLSADANGYCRSEAVVALFLQKKSQASRIYATILNSKSGSDGYKEEGITFPSRISQTRLVNETLQGLNIDVNEIGYVEAHCTGTQAGDPVELNALHDALCLTRSPDNPLYVGCLKSNIGHTEGASGLAAVSKAIIVMEKKLIPPNLHFKGPNTNIVGLVNGTQRGVSRVIPLKGEIVPVNCFGFGGANTHVLLKRNTQETELSVNQIKDTDGKRLVVLSGRTKKSVRGLTEFMMKNPEKLTPGFVHLWDNLSTFSADLGMKFKSFLVLEPNVKGGFYSVDKSVHQVITEANTSHKFSFHLDLDSLIVSNKDLSDEQRNQLVSSHARCFIHMLKSSPSSSLVANHVQKLVQDVKQHFGLDLTSFRQTDDVQKPMSNEELLLTLLITCIGTISLLQEFVAETLPIVSEVASHGISWSSLIEAYINKEITSKDLFKAVKLGLDKIKTTELNGHTARVKASESDGRISICGISGIINFREMRNPTPDLLLNSLASLHLKNLPLAMSKLYKYTGTVPSGTTFLNNFIKWDHSHKFNLKAYCSQWQRIQKQNSTNVNFHFDSRAFEDEYLFDHIVDDRILFPATGYLMMAWSAFTRLRDFSVTPIFDNPVKFTNVKFIRATMMNKSQEINFSVKINQDTGSFAIKNDDTLVVTGTVSPADEPLSIYTNKINQREDKFGKILDLNNNIDENAYYLTSKDIYKELRVRGYDYGLLFQGINKITSDGLKGQIIWRNVIPKSIRDALSSTNGPDDSAAKVNYWLKNWIPFVDCLLQFQIMNPKNTSRSLFVPTSIDTMICDPRVLDEKINSNGKFIDSVSGDTASLLDAQFDPDLGIVSTAGLFIKGLKTSALVRRPQTAALKSYQFTPYFEKEIAPNDLRSKISDYICELQKAVKDNYVMADQYYDFTKYSVLHHIQSHLFKGSATQEIEDQNQDNNFRSDLIFGHQFDFWPQIDAVLLEPQLDTMIISAVNETSSVNVLELTYGDLSLSESINRLLDDNIYYDKFDVSYLIARSDKTVDAPIDPSAGNVITFNDSENLKFSTNVVPQTMIVLNLLQSSEKVLDVSKVSAELQKPVLKDGGYLLVVYKEDISSNFNFKVPNKSSMFDSQSLINCFKNSDFKLISSRSLLQGQHPLRSLLFRKMNMKLDPQNQIVINVGLFNESEWLPKLQAALKTVQSINDGRIWIRAKNEPNLNPELSGVYGLVKTLRLEEGGSKVRCLLDLSENPISEENIFSNPKYQELLERDLVFHVQQDSKSGWGSFVHLPIPEKSISDPQLKSPVELSYLRMSKIGDLTSFYWSQTNLPVTKVESSDVNNNQSNVICDVFYSTLNFKDVMYATGGIPPEILPGIAPGDLPLGLEFSGLDRSSKKRVMGMVPFRSLATHIEIRDLDFLWDIPDNWSLEDAATIPVVYATAYYSLIVRGKITSGESILIHAAAGGVGLAALNICINRGLDVYVSVGSPEKRKFLLDNFSGHISNDRILNSRTTDFETKVLELTNGIGVDVILNSLAGDKLISGLNILAPNGRFLEIGKVDFINDTILNTACNLDHNQSFHGILLDSLICGKNSNSCFNLRQERAQLRKLISDGIVSGEIKPLPRTIFDKFEAEKAFRYLTTGKHIGKVVLKIRDESDLGLIRSPSSNSILPPRKLLSVKSANFDQDKVYLVVGGLGGFALEILNWMAVKGAKKLVVVSRRGIRDVYQKYSIDRLRSAGIDVLISNRDLTQKSETVKLFAEIDHNFGKNCLDGIFSLATTYKDIMFENQTPDDFRLVTGSKSHVTYNLDEVSRALKLNPKYFVCFSSASCGRGNPGQTSYNFANSIMEAICAKRLADGLTGLAIQWGVIGDVGVVAENSAGKDIILLGSKSQRIPSCLETLDRIMSRSDISVCLDLIKAGRGSSSTFSDSADLVKTICHIIGIKDIAAIDGAATLGSLGIDSLIAIEIKQTLERTQGLNMSLKEIRDLTVDQLIKIPNSQK